VLLWELYTYGKRPFAQYTNAEAVSKVLEGERLRPPETCPKAVSELMIKCWSVDPDDRPSFDVTDC
jgi:hypothetical protein